MAFAAAAGSAVGSLLDFGLGTISAKKQYHYARHMYKRRYRWTMKDMRKAGLNPILAAGGGFSVGSPSPGDVTVDSNFGDSLSNSARTLMEYRANKAAVANTEQDTARKRAEVELIRDQQEGQQTANEKAEIERQAAELDLQAKNRFQNLERSKAIKAVEARTRADNAAADTAGYKTPLGEVPKAAADALMERVGHSAKEVEKRGKK